MADVSRILSGRWGFSRIQVDARGNWSTHAMSQGLAGTIEAYYPPMVAGNYVSPWAVIRCADVVATPDSNTILLPRDLALAELTLGDLTTPQRDDLKNFLETWEGYQFTDWDGAIRDIPGMLSQVQTYTTSTLVRDLLRDTYRYLAHSADRPRPIVPETHNTEYTDDFSTDPFSAPRWTNDTGTAVWDSTNNELDMSFAVSRPQCRYSANDPGSIEHESQITSKWDGLFTAAAGAGVRMQSGAVEAYACTWDRTNIILVRLDSSSATTLATNTFSATAFDFVTNRLAASGSVGSNVVLDIWRTTHGSSKPSDPGWYGTDGSPDHTYTDTDAGRYDASANIQCGTAGVGAGSDYDSQSDFYKMRAITDRSGGAANPKGVFGMALHGPFGGPI